MFSLAGKKIYATGVMIAGRRKCQRFMSFIRGFD